MTSTTTISTGTTAGAGPGQRRRRMDLGRLAVVPVASGLLLLNAVSLARGWQTRGGGLEELAALVARALTMLFYGLLVVVYLRRGRARATDTSWVVQTAAVVASWLPFTLPLLGRSTAGAGQLLVADLLMVAGLGWSVVALRTLDRSFSIVPQARALVQHGPYRLVRHPLYVGELVAAAGVVLSRPSVMATFALLVLAALQVFRLLHEEAVLVATLPEYADYRRRTARLVPGVF